MGNDIGLQKITDSHGDNSLSCFAVQKINCVQHVGIAFVESSN